VKSIAVMTCLWARLFEAPAYRNRWFPASAVETRRFQGRRARNGTSRVSQTARTGRQLCKFCMGFRAGYLAFCAPRC